MRTLIKQATSLRWLALAALIALGIAGAAPAAQAAPPFTPWTAVGSTGTVDEANLNHVQFTNARALVASSAPSGTTAVLRYNVTAAEGLFNGEGLELGLRYNDSGTDERVVARLIRKNLSTGGESPMLTFDSDTKPQAAASRLDRVSDCSSSGFDFLQNVYYVQVELTKSGTAGVPTIEGLRINGIIC